ncbi:hypothetical protein BH10ACT5_BH10ACT5_22290 [soil metagenome]
MDDGPDLPPTVHGPSQVQRRHAHFGPNSLPEHSTVHPARRFLAQFIVVAAATTAAFFAELARGADLDAARATAVTVLVVAQVAVLFNVRFLRRSSLTRRVLTGNGAIWISIAVLAVLQTAYTYLPPFHVWFGSVPLTPAQWAAALGYALACFLAIEVIKAAARRLPSNRRRDVRQPGTSSR